MKTEPKQAVSTWPAAALVISNMIGIGVFMSLGWQVTSFMPPNGPSLLTGSVFPIILLWVVGGVLALCGALCYAELATALPRSGGEYNFLSRIYHPMVGFCTGLTSATIGFAAPMAIAALVFEDYFYRVVPGFAAIVPPHSVHMLAFALVTVITICHLFSLHFSGKFQAIITGLTVLLILSFVVFGFISAPTPAISFMPHAADLNLPLLDKFWGSLLWVTFAYSGWNAAAYITEEVRNPAKSLPRALIWGTLFVTFLYVTVNAVFLYSTPLSQFVLQPEVAHIAGVSIFGKIGAQIASGLICVGLVAHISATMWVGSRVNEAIGATYPVLGVLGKTSKTRVPYVSLLYQYGVIFVLLFFDPENIITYVESVLIFWSLLTVLGVIVLRVREPNLPRPYRTWGYPITPILFAAITVAGLVEYSRQHLTASLIGAATVLIGIPIYLWASRSIPTEQLRGEILPETAA